jgi:hypothetical protein
MRSKSMLRLHDVGELLEELIAVSRANGGGAQEVVISGLEIFLRIRTDDRLKALRIVTRAFDTDRALAQKLAELVYPMGALRRPPRRKKKARSASKKKPVSRVLTGRRPCRYGSGAYAQNPRASGS